MTVENEQDKKPKVSIIMSTFNRADKFLRPAIDSVIHQTEQDWELIIVDDCSTDNTEAVCKEYTDKDKRIHYVKMKQNSGSDTAPKNLGVGISRGKYIAYIDDDCEFYPYHLEVLLAKLENDPSVDLVYCDMVLEDLNNPARGLQPGIAFDWDAQFLLNRNYIDVNEVMHRRDAIFKVGGFDEKLPRFVDWNLWVRMAKAGVNMQRVPIVAAKYKLHNETKSAKVPAKSWIDPVLKISMFEPTFDPAGCYIYLPYLGNDRIEEKMPSVAIFTITYDRLEYTKRMYESLLSSTQYPWKWFVWDNSENEETRDWFNTFEGKEGTHIAEVRSEKKNVGLTKASNELLDAIENSSQEFQIIIKVDNDCQFMTKRWLETLVDLWKRNHKLYMSPYVEGLVNNPGGAPRVGHSNIGPYPVEVTQHIGGICAFVDASAYINFRWKDQFLHGNQDVEASKAFRAKKFMPCYIPMHRVLHMDTTAGQQKKFPEYFERRKLEKTQVYKDEAKRSEDQQ